MNFIGHGRLGAATGLELPDPAIILEALTRFVNPEIIGLVLKQTGRHSQRIRQLPAAAVVWLVIRIGIWTDLDVPAIWRQVVGTLRSLMLVLDVRPPGKAALSKARGRLGARVMRQLFVAASGRLVLVPTRVPFTKGCD